MLVQKLNCNLLGCKGIKMNKIKHTILLLVCSFGLTFSQFSNATIITNGCASATECSLEELINGGGINIDDIAFTNWQEIVNAIFETDGNTDNDDTVDIAQIFVAGIDSVATGNANEFILGLNFFTTSGLSLPILLDPIEEAELELDIEYDATASGGTEITATKLQLGNRNLGSDDSFVEVNLDSAALLNLQVFDEDIFGATADQLMDDITFLSGETSLVLNSNVQMGTFVDGDVELFDFSVFLTVQTDSTTPPSSVPEPSGIMLLLLSLTILLTTRYRQKS
jgi:hypothetical protein